MQKTASAASVENDAEYGALEQIIAARVAALEGPLFTTDAEGLFEAYLEAIPVEHRQHYNCHACRRFITNFGGLVTIDDGGHAHSALWDVSSGVPTFFFNAVSALQVKVHRAKVNGVFVHGPKTWGTPRTGEWTHLSGTVSDKFASKAPLTLKTDFQVAAEKKEDYATLSRGLAEFPVEAVVQAVRVLEADAVDRSEKALGVAKWLLALHRSMEGVKWPRRNNNLVWRAVATAASGWCHIRSTMINTLLDDIVKGLDFADIKRRWNEKMHPLQYQRPDPSAVKAGNIDQANKIVAKLQSEGSLQRRFAKLSEVTALWVPRDEPAPEKAGGGPFDHLKAPPRGQVREVDLPAGNIHWEKFRDTVLPGALRLEVYLPHHGPYYGLVTALNPDAPPLLQWDGLEGLPRNPVSWYFYFGGSFATSWELSPGWAAVSAVFLKPHQWQRPDLFKHHGEGVFFAIPGARDVHRRNGGSFFPEFLRQEYREIRGAMEAYSISAEVQGKAEGDANGIALNDSGLTVRVKTREGTATYRLAP